MKAFIRVDVKCPVCGEELAIVVPGFSTFMCNNNDCSEYSKEYERPTVELKPCKKQEPSDG